MKLFKFNRVRRKGANQKSFWLFGAVAVLIHLSLLLIPLRNTQLPEQQPVLQMEFFTVTHPPAPESVLEAQAEPSAQLFEEEINPDEVQAVATTVLTTRDLRNQLKEFELPVPVKSKRRLGVAYSTPLPDRLTKPVLPWEPTIFDELYAPASTEILDQWQQPDGTVMVVMRSPSGHTLCGSKAPWNPANPLFEPVPMFRECGGGGRRKRP
jgi:hypothetical protein